MIKTPSKLKKLNQVAGAIMATTGAPTATQTMTHSAEAHKAMRELRDEYGHRRSIAGTFHHPICTVPPRPSVSAVSHWLVPLIDRPLQNLCDGEMFIRIVVTSDANPCLVNDAIVLTINTVLVAVGSVLAVSPTPVFTSATHKLYRARISVLKKHTPGMTDPDLAADLQSECAQIHQRLHAINLSQCASSEPPMALPLRDQELGMDIAFDFAYSRFCLEPIHSSQTGQTTPTGDAGFVQIGS